MFDFLKKKIASWLNVAKDRKKRAKPVKISSKLKEKNLIKSKSLTKKEKQEFRQAEEIISETETPALTSQVISEAPGEEKGNFFTKLIKKISLSRLTQEDFDDAFQDLEITLLENNVALEAVDKLKEHLAKDLVGQQIKKIESPARILLSLKESILSLLIEPPNLIENIRQSKKPYIILFFGINGTGKTTSIAKLAHFFKKNNLSCVLAAADTFRAASIEQLKMHGKKVGVEVISSQYGADPASVAFEAVSYAKRNHLQAVLIDTAGRMYTKENLLKEMEKIVRVSQPDLKIFVGESITGNDAVEQARTFNEVIGIDGIILSKADVDEKAGVILSVSQVTKKPIYFLGVGQGYGDLEVFSKKMVLKNLGLE